MLEELVRKDLLGAVTVPHCKIVGAVHMATESGSTPKGDFLALSFALDLFGNKGTVKQLCSMIACTRGGVGE